MSKIIEEIERWEAERKAAERKARPGARRTKVAKKRRSSPPR